MTELSEREAEADLVRQLRELAGADEDAKELVLHRRGHAIRPSAVDGMIRSQSR